uniref:Uncharacterized protein n=1 Tax=Romanomermis culicivorax TaxID=13658 RepID=A0A915L168_ROMCU
MFQFSDDIRFLERSNKPGGLRTLAPVYAGSQRIACESIVCVQELYIYIAPNVVPWQRKCNQQYCIMFCPKERIEFE